MNGSLRLSTAVQELGFSAEWCDQQMAAHKPFVSFSDTEEDLHFVYVPGMHKDNSVVTAATSQLLVYSLTDVSSTDM